MTIRIRRDAIGSRVYHCKPGEHIFVDRDGVTWILRPRIMMFDDPLVWVLKEERKE